MFLKTELGALIPLVIILLVGGFSMDSTVPAHTKVVEEAKSNVDKLNFKILVQALERFYLDKGHYPDELEQLVPNYIFELPESQVGESLVYSLTKEGYLLKIE